MNNTNRPGGNTPDTTDPSELQAVMQNSFEMPADTAEASARDLASPGVRKPASNDVDEARAAQARAQEANEGTAHNG